MAKPLYSLSGPKTLFEMSYAEAAELRKKTDVVLIGVGSVEQHGPHLPLGADSMQVTELAKRVAVKLRKKRREVAIAPVIPFGNSIVHMEFPGSITLRDQTLVAVIKDVCRSLHSHGFTRQALLIGHVGNIPAMKIAARETHEELGAEVMVLNWISVVFKNAQKLFKSSRPWYGGEGHGGEYNTSLFMAMHPELVDMKRAKVNWSKKAEEVYQNPDCDYMFHRYKALTRSGIIGDPFVSTKETGDAIFNFAADWIVKCVMDKFPK